MEGKLEFIKMRERLEWAFEELKGQSKKHEVSVDPQVLFIQACELARMLFVRSEIQYSSKKG